MAEPATVTPKRDSTALALVWAAAIACTLTAGILLSASGSGALQQTLRMLGFGRQSAIETRQDQQALALAGLERMILTVSREVGALDTRMGVAEHKETIAAERLTRLDGDVTALRGEVGETRAARADMARLRSTIDANERAQQKTLTALTKRIDRLEQSIGRDLTAATGSVPPPAAKPAKRRERAAEPDPIADAMTELMILHGLPNSDGPSGHVIDKPSIGQ